MRIVHRLVDELCWMFRFLVIFAGLTLSIWGGAAMMFKGGV